MTSSLGACLTISAALLAGCASTAAPAGDRYTQLRWAKVPADQAHAECTSEIQRNPLQSHAVCMRAKGWQER